MEEKRFNYKKVCVIIGIFLILFSLLYIIVNNVNDSLNDKKITIVEGDSLKLDGNHSIEDDYSWESSDNSIVEVNNNGEILAKKAGEVTITFKKNGEKIKYLITVEDKDTSIAVSSVNFKNELLEIAKGDSSVLNYEILPENATNKKVSFISTNEDVCKVIDGKLIANNVGEAEIVLSAGNNKTATMKVKVFEKTVLVNKVTLDKEEVTMLVGGNISLSVNVTPENANDKNVTWVSSDSSIVDVVDGVIFAKKVGNATITVKSSNNKEASVLVHVIDIKSIEENTNNDKIKNDNVTSSIKLIKTLKINSSKKSIEVGDKINLYLSYEPSDAVVGLIKWISSNSSVASVNNKGEVIALKSGTTIITAKTDNGVTATISLEVRNKVVSVTGIKANKEAITLLEGESEKLTGIITPDNASNKEISWKSSNTNVAVVDQNGLVTTKNVGETIITLTSSNNKTAIVKVTVKKKVVDILPDIITLDKTNITLNVGEEVKLNYTINPSNVTNNSVTWSSNSNIISVKDGNIKALSKGSAKITVKTHNNKTAVCNITVVEKEQKRAMSVSLKEGTYNNNKTVDMDSLNENYTITVYYDNKLINTYNSVNQKLTVNLDKEGTFRICYKNPTVNEKCNTYIIKYNYGVKSVELKGAIIGTNIQYDTTKFDIGGADLGEQIAAVDSKGKKVYMLFGDTFSNEDLTGNWRSGVVGLSRDFDLSDGLKIVKFYTAKGFDANSPAISPLYSPHLFNPTSEASKIFTGGIQVGNYIYLFYVSRNELNKPYLLTKHNYCGVVKANLSSNPTFTRVWDLTWIDHISGKGKDGNGPDVLTLKKLVNMDVNGKIPQEDGTFKYFSEFNDSIGVKEKINFKSHYGFDFTTIAPVDGKDGYIYIFGNGGYRSTGLKVGRVKKENFEKFSSYEYFTGFDSNKNPLWSSDIKKAVYLINDPSSSTSVTYDQYIDRWVMTYLDVTRKAIVLRMSDKLVGKYSDPIVLIDQKKLSTVYGGYTNEHWIDKDGFYFTYSRWHREKNIYKTYLGRVNLERK